MAGNFTKMIDFKERENNGISSMYSIQCYLDLRIDKLDVRRIIYAFRTCIG